MKKSMLPVMLLLVAVAAFAPPPASCRAAEPNRLNFQKDESYDIYYDLEDTAFLVSNVKIIGLVTIGEEEFLEIQPNGPKDRSAYILFASIQAIFPSGSPKPQMLDQG